MVIFTIGTWLETGRGTWGLRSGIGRLWIAELETGVIESNFCRRVRCCSDCAYQGFVTVIGREWTPFLSGTPK